LTWISPNALTHIADGVQVKVTKTVQEAGIRFPVFLTRAVYDAYVTAPPEVSGQDEAGRLWDIHYRLFQSQKRVPISLGWIIAVQAYLKTNGAKLVRKASPL